MLDGRQHSKNFCRRQLRYEQLEQRQLLSINNGAIFGSLFLDIDANGRHDEVDTPLEGHDVYIDQDRNGVLDQHTLRGIGPVPQLIPDLAAIQTPLHVPQSNPISDVNFAL